MVEQVHFGHNEVIMFLIRQAVSADIESLLRLAHILNTVNLPEKAEALVEALKFSERSFSGACADPFEREYIFVAEDLQSGQVVGSSQIIAQHGTKSSPHIFFDVREIEHYSRSIDKHFKHQVLRMGFNYEGPTEVGGLVVAPEYRTNAAHLGKQLSVVRFLWIAMHRKFFRDRVLAELLPPLSEDGRSELWEALGRRFTGLTYLEADYASRTNKEFITSLFPQGTIYSTLFTDSARAAIGAVGKSSEPAKRLLESFGFEYQDRVDPFDGGPHFEAETDAILPVKNSLRATCKIASDVEMENNGALALVCSSRDAFTPKAKFLALQTQVKIVDKDRVEISQSTAKLLKADTGDELWVYCFNHTAKTD